MATKSNVDWDLIEAEYRAGQLSIREIARANNISHTAIQNRIKKYTWDKDLKERVQQDIDRKLINKDAAFADSHTRTNEAIVDSASDRGVQVVIGHRRDIKKLVDIEKKLALELEDNDPNAIVYKGEITGKVGVTVLDRSRTADNLSKIQHRRIALERQAYNIESKAPTGSESDPIHVKHSMDTSGLFKAAGGSVKDVTPKIPQLGKGDAS